MQIATFLQYLKSELRYSENTILSYQQDLHEFQQFLSETEPQLDLVAVRLQHLRNFIIHLSEKNRKASSINRKISTLKRFYKYLIKQGSIESSPAADLKNLKKPKQVHLPFSEKEMNHLKNWMADENDDFDGFQKKLIIELLYQTGMRRAELIQLEWQHLNENEGSIKVRGKRNKERIIPISEELLGMINHHQTLKSQSGIQSTYLFCLKSGEKLYPKFVYNAVKTYLSISSTKEKRSPHMLRHTFATHVLNNGAEINSVKELLGHSSLASTQVYTHQDIETLKKVFQENHPREKNS